MDEENREGGESGKFTYMNPRREVRLTVEEVKNDERRDKEALLNEVGHNK